MKFKFTKEFIIIFGIIAFLFLMYGSQLGLTKLMPFGSIISLSNVTFDGSQYWVATSTVDVGETYTLTPSQMSAMLPDGSKLKATQPVTLKIIPEKSICRYPVEMRTDKASYLGFFPQYFTYYTLGNPEQDYPFTVDARVRLGGTRFKKITLENPNNTVSPKSNPTFYLFNNKMQIKFLGALKGARNCPSPSNAIIYQDPRDKKWKLGDARDYSNYINAIKEQTNNIVGIFTNLGGVLQNANIAINQNPIHHPTAFKGYYPNEIAKPKDKGEIKLELPVGSAYALIRVKVSKDLVNSIVIHPPKGKPSIDLSWTLGGATVHGYSNGLVVKVHNSGEGDTFHGVIESNNDDVSINHTSFDLHVGANKTDKFITMVQGIRPGTSKICVTVSSGDGTEKDSKCINQTVNPQPVPPEAQPKVIPSGRNIPLGTTAAELNKNSEYNKIITHYIHDWQPPVTPAAASNLNQCGDGTALQIKNTPILFLGIIPTGQMATETKCVPTFPYKQITLLLLALLVSIGVYFMYEKTKKTKKRRGR